MAEPTQDRARETRRRVLAATVEALAQSGYAGATTQEVCRRADVSRGTLLYHFATRDQLLVAALAYILIERLEAFVASEGGTTLSPTELVPRLWAQWQGEAFSAWLELAVAARTRPELREPMRETMSAFDDRVTAAFAQLLPGVPVPPAVPFLVFAVFNGLAVGRSYEAPGQHEDVLALMTTLAEGMTGGMR